MIVTFDTNILVSGFTRPDGRASQAMVNITLRLDDLFISQPIIDELLRVLEQKFNWSAVALASVDGWISRNCHLVTPVETLSVLADEPDNRILECAVAANADLIVTGDRQMLALGNFRDTRIVTLADYLNDVGNAFITR